MTLHAPLISDEFAPVMDINGAGLVADRSGALYWPDERLLVVSDLHLEKGSSFAARGVLLPPFDSAATLARLVDVMARYNPRRVIALGDSFHDLEAHRRLPAQDGAALAAMQTGRDWVWVRGNHDFALPPDFGGAVINDIPIGPLRFRHEPSGEVGEIAGHLHPKARVSVRGRAIARRCFAASGTSVVMPAFGAYTGGLSIRDRAFAALFGRAAFTAYLLGERAVHAIASTRCS